MIGFFNTIGMPITLSEFGIDPREAAERVGARFAARGTMLDEHNDLSPDQVAEILRMSQ
jgi:glycerol dehydrogenase-like iron-containing ADH family enzyme